MYGVSTGRPRAQGAVVEWQRRRAPRGGKHPKASRTAYELRAAQEFFDRCADWRAQAQPSDRPPMARLDVHRVIDRWWGAARGKETDRETGLDPALWYRRVRNALKRRTGRRGAGYIVDISTLRSWRLEAAPVGSRAKPSTA